MVIKPQKASDRTESGIIIPDSAKEKLYRGTVVAVGPGLPEKPTEYSEGDTVLYSQYAGTDIVINDEKLLIMRDNDVFGRVVEIDE